MQAQTTETLPVASSTPERDRILAALGRWIRQRPGLEFGNYGEMSAYRSELRSITKDLHQARTLLAAVSWRSSIGAEELKDALKHSYAGRLSWDGEKLEYCTGQYWPTEYRRVVCAVLASALWAYTRENMESQRGGYADGPDGESKAGYLLDGEVIKRPGDYLRAWAKREFGKAIANRWFN